MHRVLRKVVRWFFLLLLAFPIQGQTILDGEFGAAKKPLEQPGKDRVIVAPRPGPVPPPAGVSGSAAGGTRRESPTKTVAGEEIPAGSKRYPFHGQLDRVAEDGGSIVLAGKTKERVILITPRTNITRDGRRVSTKEAAKGERVSGSVVKNAEGREQALTLRLKGMQ